MSSNHAQYDLLKEIADARQQKPWPSGVHSRTLLKKPDLRIVLILLDAAARLKEHHADGSSSLYVLNGHVSYHALGEAYDLRVGSLFALDASIPHSVEAVEDSALLLTISWPGDQKLREMQHRGYGS